MPKKNHPPEQKLKNKERFAEKSSRPSVIGANLLHIVTNSKFIQEDQNRKTNRNSSESLRVEIVSENEDDDKDENEQMSEANKKNGEDEQIPISPLVRLKAKFLGFEANTNAKTHETRSISPTRDANKNTNATTSSRSRSLPHHELVPETILRVPQKFPLKAKVEFDSKSDLESLYSSTIGSDNTSNNGSEEADSNDSFDIESQQEVCKQSKAGLKAATVELCQLQVGSKAVEITIVPASFLDSSIGYWTTKFLQETFCCCPDVKATKEMKMKAIKVLEQAGDTNESISVRRLNELGLFFNVTECLVNDDNEEIDREVPQSFKKEDIINAIKGGLEQAFQESKTTVDLEKHKQNVQKEIEDSKTTFVDYVSNGINSLFR